MDGERASTGISVSRRAWVRYTRHMREEKMSGGVLHFVGRSLDSMYDLLTGVLADSSPYGTLYALLRDWADDEREPWDVIRRKIRFIGVVSR